MKNFCLIVPTRGDRPAFIQQCKQLISAQTLQPREVIWMDYPPVSGVKDITQRYRRGVERAAAAGYEFAVFWEDDDWYHPEYLEWLIGSWEAAGRPGFFGVGETYYYHLGLESHIHMKHPGRTSMFCTLAKLPWRIKWPDDSNPFLDMHIHKTTKVKTIDFPQDRIYAIGIKHGIGKTGGGGHNGRLNYQSDKRDWFIKHVGRDLRFYDTVKRTISGPSQTYQTVPKINLDGSRVSISSNPSSQLSGGRSKIKVIRRR